MLVEGKPYRTVWAEGKSHERPVVRMIDQKILPFVFAIHDALDVSQTCIGIKDMTVRGAGAIGATAGFAMAQGFAEGDPEAARKAIEATRPTAYNLFNATKRVFEAGDKSSANSLADARAEAERIADEDAASCEQIGQHGAKLLEDGMTIMTQCNAGWLAFVDWGSALSPVYAANRQGNKVKVIANYTGPRGQGGRLTAWELINEGIENVVQWDTAVAHSLQHEEVKLIIVGADRIATNGDVANKIGTHGVAIMAKRLGVPFYVAAPTSTIDPDCPTGEKIPIEDRSGDEVLYQTGQTDDGKIVRVRITAPGSKALNPAFDVTPAELIKGIITQKDIFVPDRIQEAL